jgi:hypothetical protein
MLPISVSPNRKKKAEVPITAKQRNLIAVGMGADFALKITNASTKLSIIMKTFGAPKIRKNS